jgi:putative transposase
MAQLLALMKSIHAEVKAAYGSPRMHRELRPGSSDQQGRVERLMREHGIRGRHKRRYKATTDSKHSLPVADEPARAQTSRPSGAESGLDGRHHLPVDR